MFDREFGFSIAPPCHRAVAFVDRAVVAAFVVAYLLLLLVGSNFNSQSGWLESPYLIEMYLGPPMCGAGGSLTAAQCLRLC